ncbi:MAG TPA: hypothetical protein PK886_01595 [Candidatus Paceibacterota bacterium]|nr:hypothetical protein [Candidatus Paceibacterota bacterium]
MEGLKFDQQEHEDEKERLFQNDTNRRGTGHKFVPIEEAADKQDENDPYKEVNFAFHPKSPEQKQQEINEQRAREEEELEEEAKIKEEEKKEKSLIEKMRNIIFGFKTKEEKPEDIISTSTEKENGTGKIRQKESMSMAYKEDPSAWRDSPQSKDRGWKSGSGENLKTMPENKTQRRQRKTIKKFIEGQEDDYKEKPDIQSTIAEDLPDEEADRQKVA